MFSLENVFYFARKQTNYDDRMVVYDTMMLFAIIGGTCYLGKYIYDKIYYKQ
ncbi:hypothetical protein [Megavirus chiliensis]|uniref:Uncharacterized protein n=2 Tax=Megamimivirinae TaxID=3044648 RepID=A0A2L2DNU7_MIMIV|nr:hypothetical protein MegaChil _gp0987 [Megavirus chiliensis]AEQ33048.1 hypothetical protein [Megavirus chiliensis]AVG47824.1 hypothetical protein [Acanthamoeba polyphaga mimivirus]